MTEAVSKRPRAHQDQAGAAFGLALQLVAELDNFVPDGQRSN